MNNTGSKWSLILIQWGLVALALLLWEVGARANMLDPFYFSTPLRIAKNIAVWLHAGLLIKHLTATLAEAAAGFALGLLLGMAAGFALAVSRKLDAVLQPFVAILNAMPRIAFAPLIILWFGLGFVSKVVIVVSLVFFIVFFNTYSGWKDINPIILKNARVLGATRLQMFWHIYLPATMVWTFASLRVSVGFAIIGAVLGEYIGASKGIGYLIDNAQANFDATGVMSGLTVLTIVVAVLNMLLQRVETRFLSWRMSNQSTGGQIA